MNIKHINARTLYVFVLWFCPHFSISFAHMPSHALSFPHHLPMCSHHVPPNHGTYPHLCCTHVHYLICSCPCLVPYGYAMASYHKPLTRLSITHSSPFLYYTAFPFGTLPDPHILSSSEALCFFPWPSTILSFIYCFTFQTQTFPYI